MALINCPECGTPVSDQAVECPRCAHPITISKNSDDTAPILFEPYRTPYLILSVAAAVIPVLFFVTSMAIEAEVLSRSCNRYLAYWWPKLPYILFTICVILLALAFANYQKSKQPYSLYVSLIVPGLCFILGLIMLRMN